ncbi:Hypothetical protein NTJ_01233 [Nesidiocoris tenuis]|uniref:GAG-pre-integrase domain-containing protein n=1 Tax=Nesidiocoris tenuis TaxID=355587 RepID=A0ABN7AC73_9HEMI|nr:Hypothetical protein NTJ_01233 [Nesidiocoris tenuis]
MKGDTCAAVASTSLERLACGSWYHWHRLAPHLNQSSLLEKLGESEGKRRKIRREKAEEKDAAGRESEDDGIVRIGNYRVHFCLRPYDYRSRITHCLRSEEKDRNSQQQ